MRTITDRLATDVLTKLRAFEVPTPSLSLVRSLLTTAYLATLKTEEARFVRGSITFAAPNMPDIDPPFRRRADYPGFTRLRHPIPLSVTSLVKLARAIDQWCGSIAVFGRTPSTLMAWGVLDQLVGQNVRLNRETKEGFSNPGILTITMDAVGALSAYHGDVFLAGVREDSLVTQQNDALQSPVLQRRTRPVFLRIAEGIASALGDSATEPIQERLFEEWSNTLARLCISVRRSGTGGSLLITAKPELSSLDIHYACEYRRLSDGLAFHVLDELYFKRCTEQQMNQSAGPAVPTRIVRQRALAEEDANDRESEVTGAVKVVASMASVDGLVLLTTGLKVIGFGVKIVSGTSVGAVYDGPSVVYKSRAARKVDVTRFGTRHSSMLRYCRLDPAAVGVVISQDGHVRVIMSVGRRLTLWDDVKVLGYQNFSAAVVRGELARRARRRVQKWKFSLGYTPMPKTMATLLAKVATND